MDFVLELQWLAQLVDGWQSSAAAAASIESLQSSSDWLLARRRKFRRFFEAAVARLTLIEWVSALMTGSCSLAVACCACSLVDLDSFARWKAAERRSAL